MATEAEEFRKELKDFADSVAGEFKKEASALLQKFDDNMSKYAKGEDLQNVKISLDKIESDVTELKQQAANRGFNVDGVNSEKSFNEILQDAVVKAIGAKKDSDERRKAKAAIKAKSAIEFEVKAAAPITRAIANPTNGSRIPAWQREPGVAKSPDNRPFVTDLVTIGVLPLSDTLSWVERIDRQGGAASVSEGSAYALVSTAYEERSAKAQKIGARTKMTLESIDDIDFLMSEIQNELIDSQVGVNYILDQQLFAGDGNAPNLKGILEYATTFAAPSGFSVENPNYFDALMALQLRLSLSNFIGGYAIVNPVELAMMRTTKDKDGNYLLPPFATTSAVQVAGFTLVPHNSVTQGQFCVGDFSRSGLYIRRGLNVVMATENEDDFNKDFVTIKASVRALHRIKEVDEPAFLTGTFAEVKEAIMAV